MIFGLLVNNIFGLLVFIYSVFSFLSSGHVSIENIVFFYSHKSYLENIQQVLLQQDYSDLVPHKGILSTQIDKYESIQIPIVLNGSKKYTHVACCVVVWHKLGFLG